VQPGSDRFEYTEKVGGIDVLGWAQKGAKNRDSEPEGRADVLGQDRVLFLVEEIGSQGSFRGVIVVSKVEDMTDNSQDQ
jgi:hypothetical protein